VKGEELGLCTLVAFLVVLSILVQSGGGGLIINTEMEVTVDEQLQVRLDYTLSSTGFSKSVNILTYSTLEIRDGPIYIFYDNKEVESSYLPRIAGLYDHLNPRLQSYGYDDSVSLVGREVLEDIFTGPNATLILANSISQPDTIAQMALDWVIEGGILIGIGNGSIPFVFDPRYDTGGDGYIALRYEKMAFRSGDGMNSSTMAEAFNLETVAPTDGILVDDVESQSGTVVGYTYDREQLLTSAALFKIGKGRLLTLSGNISAPIQTSGEEAYANDIAKLLASWALWMEGEPFLKKIACGPESASGIIVAELPIAEHVAAVSFDTDEFQDVFQRIYLTINT